MHERSRSKYLKWTSESRDRLQSHSHPKSNFAWKVAEVPFEQHGSPTFSDYFANHRWFDNRRSREEKIEAKDVPTCWINSNRAYPREVNRGNEVERKKIVRIFLLRSRTNIYRKKFQLSKELKLRYIYMYIACVHVIVRFWLWIFWWDFSKTWNWHFNIHFGVINHIYAHMIDRQRQL